MADLAKRRQPSSNVRQRTRNRDTLLPPRRQTNLPDPEINSRVLRPDDSGAYELRRILGLANDAASSVASFANEEHLQREAERGAQASADFAIGRRDDETFERSRAYRTAYHREQATAAAFDYERLANERATELLNGETIPDLEDFQEMLDGLARERFLDEHGNFRDTFTDTPAASRLLATAMANVRGRVLAEASQGIRARTNDDFLRTRATNAYRNYASESDSFLDQARQGNAPNTGTVQEVDVAPSAATPQGTSSDNSATQENRRVVASGIAGQAATELRRYGLPEPVIAGFLGNFEIESAGWDPHASGDGRTAHGFAQWRGDRVQNFIRIIGVHPRSASVEQQMRFVKWELDHPQAAGMSIADRNRILRARTAGEAAAIIDEVYEVSSGQHRRQRVAAARRYFDGQADDLSGLPNDPTFTDQPAAVASGQLPSFNFEDLMVDLPPGMDRGVAKRTMLAAIMEAAEEAGDYRVMERLIQSNRADGTPSFNMDEIASIRDTRERIRDRNRVEAERQRSDRYEQNGNALIDTIIESGQLPTPDQIRNYREQDRISPQLAYSLFNAYESETEQAGREQRAEEREAQRDRDYELDVTVEAEIAERRAGVGVLAGATAENDQRRLNAGEFGEGPRALARYRRLRAAAAEGETAVMREPESIMYAQFLRDRFTPRRRGGGSHLLNGNRPDELNPVPGMLAEYRRLRLSGQSPHEAAQGAIIWKNRTYGTNDDPVASAQRRVQALRQQAQRR